MASTNVNELHWFDQVNVDYSTVVSLFSQVILFLGVSETSDIVVSDLDIPPVNLVDWCMVENHLASLDCSAHYHHQAGELPPKAFELKLNIPKFNQ